MGTVYAAGTTERAAVISDLDFYDCEAFRGPARQDCATTEDCAEGLRCEGVVNGRGSCIDTTFTPDGEGTQCTNSLDCLGVSDSGGLVCAGENYGGGICYPAWMRRHFYQEPNLIIDGEGITLTLDSFGLATVHTDISLDLFLFHDDVSQLRVVLENPTGTESVIHGPETNGGMQSAISLRGEPLMAFPSDEDANGTWTLRMENLDEALTGRIIDFGLEVTSRWD